MELNYPQQLAHRWRDDRCSPGQVRSELDRLIRAAFAEPDPRERAGALDFNARLVTELRIARVWPPQAAC
ncbi:MAG: hypothetical protein R3C15_15540 [Thermoleophilia bacterium]